MAELPGSFRDMITPCYRPFKQSVCCKECDVTYASSCTCARYSSIVCVAFL